MAKKNISDTFMDLWWNLDPTLRATVILFLEDSYERTHFGELWLHVPDSVSHLASAFALVDDFECVLSARGSLHTLSHHCKVAISNHPSHLVPLSYRGRNLRAFLHHLSYNTSQFNCQSWTGLCRSISVYWTAQVCTPLGQNEAILFFLCCPKGVQIFALKCINQKQLGIAI